MSLELSVCVIFPCDNDRRSPADDRKVTDEINSGFDSSVCALHVQGLY